MNLYDKILVKDIKHVIIEGGDLSPFSFFNKDGKKIASFSCPKGPVNLKNVVENVQDIIHDAKDQYNETDLEIVYVTFKNHDETIKTAVENTASFHSRGEGSSKNS